MKKYNRAIKAISLVLVASFLLEQVAFATPDLKLAKLDLFAKPIVNLGIPESIATIEDSWKSVIPSEVEGSKNDKCIYLIQDAHTNPSGQFNLAKTLDHLLTTDKQLKYIFVEAGLGNDSLSFFRKYGTKNQRKEAAEPFVRSGQLHGEEYLDLTSNHNFTIWGVEDLNLYKKSLEDYQYVAKERSRFQSYLERIQTTINTLKTRIYNPLLLSFDQKHEKYQKEELSLTDYFEILHTQAQILNINLNLYPDLKALKSLKDKESSIDFKKANLEQQEALKSLNPKDQKELQTLIDKRSPSKLSNNDHKEDKAFYSLLEEKLSKSTHPELTKYFEYIKLSKSINTKLILSELKSLESEVYNHLTQTEDERIFLRAQSTTHLLTKLFNLTLTPEEYQDYKSLTSNFDITYLTGFLNKKIMDLHSLYERAIFLEPGYEDIVKRSQDFYELTYSRDTHFIRETMNKMTQENQTHSVLITGGFHTPSLKSILKNNNISYISITPQVLKETNIKRYEEILLGQESLLSKNGLNQFQSVSATINTFEAKLTYGLVTPAQRINTTIGRLFGRLSSVLRIDVNKIGGDGARLADTSAQPHNAPLFYEAKPGLIVAHNLILHALKIIDQHYEKFRLAYLRDQAEENSKTFDEIFDKLLSAEKLKLNPRSAYIYQAGSDFHSFLANVMIYTLFIAEEDLNLSVNEVIRS